MSGNDKSVSAFGQVFTPDRIVDEMLALRKNRGAVLEPSCGAGAFIGKLGARAVGIEIDGALLSPQQQRRRQNIKRAGNIIHGDFFQHATTNKYDTIIGNPPYVRHQDILPQTKAHLPMALFDRRSNLYLFFIEKCLRHLRPGGELIFITPRDFLKATAARKLNRRLYEEGAFSHWRELGDATVFRGYTPNCAIWRWQKGRKSRRTAQGEFFNYCNGQIWFGDRAAATRAAAGDNARAPTLADFFDIKVGAVSGADHIFASERHGNVDMVCSTTARDGKTRRMLYNTRHSSLRPHKPALLARKVRAFNESNWWQWGRRYFHSDKPRVYVNGKTRQPRPFFAHGQTAYDGSVLALIPKSNKTDVWRAAEALNNTDWHKMGFVVDGRLLFTQRSLATLPFSL